MEEAKMDRRLTVAATGALAACISLGACTTMEAADLNGTWRLSSIDGQQVEASASSPHFTIDGNTINGFDGCNQFGGQLDQPQSLFVGQRECVGAVLNIPINLSDPQEHLATANVDGDRLAIPAQNGYPASVFHRDK